MPNSVELMTVGLQLLGLFQRISLRSDTARAWQRSPRTNRFTGTGSRKLAALSAPSRVKRPRFSLSEDNKRDRFPVFDKLPAPPAVSTTSRDSSDLRELRAGPNWNLASHHRRALLYLPIRLSQFSSVPTSILSVFDTSNFRKTSNPIHVSGLRLTSTRLVRGWSTAV